MWSLFSGLDHTRVSLGTSVEARERKVGVARATAAGR